MRENWEKSKLNLTSMNQTGPQSDHPKSYTYVQICFILFRTFEKDFKDNMSEFVPGERRSIDIADKHIAGKYDQMLVEGASKNLPFHVFNFSHVSQHLSDKAELYR